MKFRMILLVGVAAGLVLASKRGRRAVTALSEKAQEAWTDPNLQKVISQTEQSARDAAAAAQNKVGALVDQATAAVGTAREQAVKASKHAQAQVSDVVDAAVDAVGRDSDTN